jgi:hypothetical protein
VPGLSIYPWLGTVPSRDLYPVPETSLQHDHDRHDPVPVLSKGSEEGMEMSCWQEIGVTVTGTAMVVFIFTFGYMLGSTRSTK